MLTRTQKQEQIDALREAVVPTQGLFVMDFTGLTVAEVTELRQKVRAAAGNYRVVKNTLAHIAVADSNKQGLQSLLTGPIAFAYTTTDPVNLAKALADFAKTHDKLRFRGGVVEGQVLDANQAKQVAQLPSKAELVARLLFLIQSPMRRLVTALAWPVKGLAVSVRQIAEARDQQVAEAPGQQIAEAPGQQVAEARDQQAN